MKRKRPVQPSPPARPLASRAVKNFFDPRGTPLHVTLIVTAIFATYAGSFSIGWLFDDRPVIVLGQSIRNVASCFHRLGSSPRSLVQLSFALNYAFGALNPWGYHLVNLAVHTAAALCVYGWLRTVLTPERSPLALFAALMFGLHPLTVQSVSYVTQRYSSMAGMFFLGSLWTWALYRKLNRVRWYAAGLACAVGGMLCKEMAVAIPLALLAADYSLHADARRAAAVRRGSSRLVYLPVLALLAVVPALNLIGKRLPVSSLSESLNWAAGQDITRWTYFLSQTRIIVFIYLRLMLAPIGLSVDHPYQVVRSLSDLPTLVAILILALLLIAGGLAAFRTNTLATRLSGFGILLFFFGLGATSSLVPNAEFVQEQRAYVSLAGIVTVLATAAWFFIRDPLMRTTACSLVIIGLALGTYQRNKVWQSEWLLWQDALDQYPVSCRALTNIGAILAERGELDAAIDHYQRAIQTDPRQFLPHYNLGSAWSDKGLLEQAIPEYRRAIEIYSTDFRAHYNLGNALRQLGRVKEAVAVYRQAILLAPNDFRIHFNLAIALQQQGKTKDATDEYRTVLRIKPDHQKAKSNLESLIRTTRP